MGNQEWKGRARSVFGVLLVVFVMISLDGLFAWLSIPVVSMDLILLGLSLLIIIFGFKVRFKLGDLLEARSAMSLSLAKRLGYSLLMLLLVGMGVYLTIEGFNNPLELFTGVKGASHGYTVVVLGALITIYSLLGLFIFFPGRNNSD